MGPPPHLPARPFPPTLRSRSSRRSLPGLPSRSTGRRPSSKWPRAPPSALSRGGNSRSRLRPTELLTHQPSPPSGPPLDSSPGRSSSRTLMVLPPTPLTGSVSVVSLLTTATPLSPLLAPRGPWLKRLDFIKRNAHEF